MPIFFNKSDVFAAVAVVDAKSLSKGAERDLAFFLYISLPSLHDYYVKLPNFAFCGKRKHKTTTLCFFSSLLMEFFRFQLPKNYPRFDEMNEMK